METWLESVAALPMATSQELRWGVLLGMAIGGSLVALINYIRDCRRQHIGFAPLFIFAFYSIFFYFFNYLDSIFT
jgi:hypothetical protein